MKVDSIIDAIERTQRSIEGCRGPVDPFGLGFGSFAGIKIIEEAKHPRYVLPDDVPPPPGMTRAEFAAWSAEVCGFREPIVPRDTVYFMPGLGAMVMRPESVVKLTGI
jgi:hypothetical protein